MKQSLFFAGLLALCLGIGLSACGSFLDDPLQTPANFTITASPTMAYLSWDTVTDAAQYRIRLNGEEVQDVTGTSWRHDNAVKLGDTYTVSALYSGGREGPPAGRIVRYLNTVPPYPYPPNSLADTEEDKSRSIVSTPGTALPAQWYDTALSSGQTAHYYVIPISTGFTNYRIWWNDRLDGDSTKTLNIQVSAWWYGTDTEIITYPVDSGYYGGPGITINTGSADNTGYAVLKVEAEVTYPDEIGTYGIAYNYQ
jgi:hypothetical protein